MCIKPLKYACRSLEEGSKEIIPPSIFSPTFGGPRNQVEKDHHKLKRYGIVYFFRNKMGHKARNVWHYRRPTTPYKKCFWYCKLNGHWEAKCWMLHLKLYTKN